MDGEKLTGTAKSDNGTVTIENGTVKGDDVSFVENLDYQGQKLAITYVGKISGDEIKFTRDVAGAAKEDLVASELSKQRAQSALVGGFCFRLRDAVADALAHERTKAEAERGSVRSRR